MSLKINPATTFPSSSLSNSKLVDSFSFQSHELHSLHNTTSSFSLSSSVEAKKITLQSADGELFHVEEPVVMKLEIVKTFFEDNDDVDNEMVVPLLNVGSKSLPLIFEYCRAHLDPLKEDVKAFDAAFVEKISNEQLKEVVLAAHYLDIKELLDLLTEVTAKRIENKSVEYVRDFFGIENDFTPEEEAKLRAEFDWAFEGVDED